VSRPPREEFRLAKGVFQIENRTEVSYVMDLTLTQQVSEVQSEYFEAC